MSAAVVALALDTALDVAAARRLHDYGDLDDADVQRALEQLRMQRDGAIEWPAHLRRICYAAAVIDIDGDVNVVCCGATADEATLLAQLSSAWPAVDNGTVVTWHGDAAALIAARAFYHDRTLAHGIVAWPRVALARRLQPGGAPGDEPDSELSVLLDASDDGPADTRAHVVARAIAHYRWWLRWQAVIGAMTADARAARETRLAAASARVS